MQWALVTKIQCGKYWSVLFEEIFVDDFTLTLIVYTNNLSALKPYLIAQYIWI